MNALGRLELVRRDGTEPFYVPGCPLGFDLLSFWQWSCSDVVNNALRGVLAEFLVAQALGVAVGTVRQSWSPYDLKAADGTRVEVKSAAYIQSWHQRQLSKITFRVAKTRAWDNDTNQRRVDPQWQADVYVFALLAHADKRTLDPLNLSQWNFYVVHTKALDDRLQSQLSIALPALRSLAGESVDYSGLKRAVEAAGELQERKV